MKTNVVLTFIFLSITNFYPTKLVAQELELINAFPKLSYSEPIFLTHSNDGTNRVFVVEQRGNIIVHDNDSEASETTVFLDISDSLATGSELGLLGLAFHPDYANNGVFFINYTAPLGSRWETRISKLTASGNQADITSEEIILRVAQPFLNHNGGMIAFGTDGFLYIALGDGGSGGDPQRNGQNTMTMLGSILRIDVDTPNGETQYSIPADNPFIGSSTALEEIFAYGLRNPWRFSIDPQTGQIWAGDVGQNRLEEIDLIESGKNYGWRLMEGFDCFNPSNCDQAGLTLPIVDYSHSAGSCSVTGGTIYRGAARPELQGAYIYGDFCSGRIWMLRYENGQVTADSLLLNTNLNISSFGTDEQQELYVINLSGAIYRFNESIPTGTGEDINNAPEQITLKQNYPNPFNPTTTIKYSVQNNQTILIEIFNSLGQKIKTLVNRTHTPGEHSIFWNGQNDEGAGLPSGIYYYQFIAGSQVIARKMILLK